MHFAVIQTAFLGDLFLSIPLLKNLKRIYPEARLTLVCRQGLGEVFKTFALVDQVLEIQKNEKSSYNKAVQTLNAQSVDFLLCPHKSFRSGLMAQKIKVSRQKISFQQWWNFWIFDRTIPYPAHLPDALRQLSLLSLLNPEFRLQYETAVHKKELQNTSVTSESVDFRQVDLPDWSKMEVPDLQRASREPQVVLAPGSVWNTKKWKESGFAEVASRLVGQGMNVVLMGSKAEHEICERIRKQVPKAINMAGQTSLEESLRLLAKSRLLISNDSGAMHLASATGTPTVSIFGPTTLDIGYRPWNQQSIVVQKSLKCRPCGKHGHKECPLGTHECMISISSDEVYKQAEKFL